MAQILVRNIPDEVKSRLQRRAELHKRSLEAEVRDILAQVPEPTRGDAPKEGIGTMLAKKFAETPIPQETWDEFDKNIAALRRAWTIRDADL